MSKSHIWQQKKHQPSFGKFISFCPFYCIYSGTVTQWVEQSIDPASSISSIPAEATHSKIYKMCIYSHCLGWVSTKAFVLSAVILIGLVSDTLTFLSNQVCECVYEFIKSTSIHWNDHLLIATHRIKSIVLSIFVQTDWPMTATCYEYEFVQQQRLWKILLQPCASV